jgi:hypothetical protein
VTFPFALFGPNEPTKHHEFTAPIKVVAHLLRLDGALEDRDYYGALPDADRQRAAEISSLPQRAAFPAARKALRELLAAPGRAHTQTFGGISGYAYTPRKRNAL